mgnify:CR=1 FL=1
MKCPTCNGTGEIDVRDVSLGVVIAARRNELKLKQQELADLIGVSRTTLANMETGRQSIPIERVRPLATALELEVGAFLP